MAKATIWRSLNYIFNILPRLRAMAINYMQRKKMNENKISYSYKAFGL